MIETHVKWSPWPSSTKAVPCYIVNFNLATSRYQLGTQMHCG